LTDNLPYLIAPPGWDCRAPNPFTVDGSYGPDWSAFCLLDRDDDQFVTGQSGRGPFAARLGRRVAHLPERLADFLRYEGRHGRTVILSFPPEVDPREYLARALAGTPASGVVRAYDPGVVVHATTAEAWQSIQDSGALLAASQLVARREVPGSSDVPGSLEDYRQHEPPEYGDYIMFGEMDSCVPEMVVASYQAGRFALNENAVFRPGVRLYFDNHRLIRDGLGVRDGLHVIKVHLRLPLRPCMLGALSPQDLDPPDQVSAWTPRSFVERANAAFRSLRGQG
jgi:hypothetical protein